MKQSRLLGVAILLAVTALPTALWVEEGPLWRMVMLETTEFTSPGKVAERRTVKRWGKHKGRAHGRRVLSHWNGFKAQQTELVNGSVDGVVTFWSQDGRVVKQERYVIGRFVETTKGPPWMDGVTDQTKPTAPWWDHEKNRAKE